MKVHFKEKPYTEVGQVIMRHCVDKNITISEFAKRINTRLSTVSVWIHGSHDTVKRIVLPRECSLFKIKNYNSDLWFSIDAIINAYRDMEVYK